MAPNVHIKIIDVLLHTLGRFQVVINFALVAEKSIQILNILNMDVNGHHVSKVWWLLTSRFNEDQNIVFAMIRLYTLYIIQCIYFRELPCLHSVNVGKEGRN